MGFRIVVIKSRAKLEMRLNCLIVRGVMYGNLLEKYICYINALIELKECQFFVFVNLKSVLDDEALQQLYHHCKLEKVGLLLLESCKLRPLLSSESAIIITEDLCECRFVKDLAGVF